MQCNNYTSIWIHFLRAIPELKYSEMLPNTITVMHHGVQHVSSLPVHGENLLREAIPMRPLTLVWLMWPKILVSTYVILLTLLSMSEIPSCFDYHGVLILSLMLFCQCLPVFLARPTWIEFHGNMQYNSKVIDRKISVLLYNLKK